MPYRIDLADAPADILERLVALEALDVEERDGTIAAILPDRVGRTGLSKRLGVTRLRVSAAVGRDDGSVWVLRQRPVQVGRWLVVPAGADAPDGAIQLTDSGAFGTGLHPTTALCMELVEQVVDDFAPSSMLDVGIGSGILALAALLAGVPSAVGLDIEQAALDASRENAALNGLAHRLTLHKGGPECVQGTWPFIVANVLAAPLTEMAPVLVQRLGHRGRLVLSGIPELMAPDVEGVYRRRGLRHVMTDVRAGWSVVVMDASW